MTVSLFTAVHSRRMSGNSKSRLHEVQTKYLERVFHHEDSQAVEQVALKGCLVSILGGFQETSG